MTKVIGELAIVRPTVFGAVPRTLNKLFGTGVNIFVNDDFNSPGRPINELGNFAVFSKFLELFEPN